MIEYILLASMAIVVTFMLLLRTNTAICFLALCAGSVLLVASGDNLSLVANSLTSGIDTSTNISRILLLITPFLVCAVMLRFHLKTTQLLPAMIPAVASALLAAIYIVPELSIGTQNTLKNTETWSLLTQYQEAIIVIGLVSSLFMIFLTVKRPEPKHKKGRH